MGKSVTAHDFGGQQSAFFETERKPMRRQTAEHDWAPDDDGDREDDEEFVPDDDDISLEELSEQDEKDSIPCPYCHEFIHEDSQRCPYCEHYISEEDVPRQRKPWWIIIGILVTLAIALMWALRG